MRFRSYLILGNDAKREAETAKLAKAFNIKLKRGSPDVSTVSPQKSSISIQDVRELKRHIFQKPISSPYKLVIIKEAHTLTIEAQNALLKILEEPPETAIIILEADENASFLPTVLSRLAIVKSKNHIEVTSSLFQQNNTFELLKEVANEKDPEAWIDNQLVNLHQELKKAIGGQKSATTFQKTISLIETLKEAKQMVKANVNPRFVLSNFVFSSFER